VLVRVICWYAYTIVGKCEFFVEKSLESVKDYFLRTKKYPPVGGRREGVKNEKVLVRVVCWYTYTILTKYEYSVTKVFGSS
jgi:hypothetical protein